MGERRNNLARRRSRAFTLVELVMVTVIIAMLASMAIPRIASGTTSASESSVKGDVAVMSKAILMYAAEHNNEFPGPTGAIVANQLTQYSDVTGRTATGRSGAFQFGPYLVSIPALPTGRNAGRSNIIIDNVNSPPQPRVNAAGWVYNPNTGEIRPNDGEIKVDGTEEVAADKLDGESLDALDEAGKN